MSILHYISIKLRFLLITVDNVIYFVYFEKFPREGENEDKIIYCHIYIKYMGLVMYTKYQKDKLFVYFGTNEVVDLYTRFRNYIWF